MVGQWPLPLLPGQQGLWNVSAAAHLHRQRHRVGKRHVGGLAKIGRHRGRGIAEDCDMAFRPVAGADIDDTVPAADLADMVEQVAGARKQPAPQRRVHRPGAAAPIPYRAAKIDVVRAVGAGIEHAPPGAAPVFGDDVFRVAFPSVHQHAKAAFAAVIHPGGGEDVFAPPRIGAVRHHHQVGPALRPVFQHQHALRPHRRNDGGGEDFHIKRGGTVDQRLVEVGPRRQQHPVPPLQEFGDQHTAVAIRDPPLPHLLGAIGRGFVGAEQA